MKPVYIKFRKLNLQWLLGLSFLTGCTTVTDLPHYVVINNAECANREVLTTPAKEVSFPLSAENQTIVDLLVEKFRQEKNCAGLAAPQIGFNCRIIVFSAPDDPKLKKWRPDLSDTMGETLWLNPSYQGLSDKKFSDYEGCFSVHGLGGPVARFEEISYRAYNAQGKIIEGKAKGFLARIIQHEVDHLNGILFWDLIEKDQLLPIETYRKIRSDALKQGR
ncbi:MAG: peptide deformylase [Janthinobacterium lividum]